MEDRQTDPGCAGRHLRANSTPPESAGWNSKTKQRWGKGEKKKHSWRIYINIINIQ